MCVVCGVWVTSKVNSGCAGSRDLILYWGGQRDGLEHMFDLPSIEYEYTQGRSATRQNIDGAKREG